MYLSNQSFNIHLPREFDYQSLPGGGEFDPHALGVGEFELHPRFHVKFLAWRAIIGDAVLEDFRGKIVPYLKVFEF